MRTRAGFYAAVMTVFLSGCKEPVMNQTAGNGTDWPVYGGNPAGNRYSPLRQINKENVRNLKVVWTYDAAEAEKEGQRAGQIQCQPIVVDGILYGTTPGLKLFALRADTGEQVWKFSPSGDRTQGKNTSRGVVYWEGNEEQRILYTVGPTLYAIDARNGQPVKTFGEQGKADLHLGLDVGLDKDVQSLSVTATSPGVLYKDLLIIGSSVSEGGDAAPGHIRAFNVVTGKLEWVFRTIPQPGDPGYETWPENAYSEVGGANNWAGMVLDEERGAVYFGTGSPSSDFYGGNREGKNLYANCIIALDAATGALQWHYQTIYHDLWDRDISCPPNLTTITLGGEEKDVVVQATKDGLVYVLDRDTGKSVFPVEERPVPVNGLPGEHPWPVQKYPLKPEPFSRQVLTDADITDISEEARTYVKEQLKKYTYAHKFTPPDEKGTVLFGYSGGAEWGGNAIDTGGILYQNANEEPWILQMVSIDSFKAKGPVSAGQGLYLKNCAMCHGTEREGGGQFPVLKGLAGKFSSEEVHNIVKNGSGRMPSFQHLSEEDTRVLSAYILDMPEAADKQQDKHRKVFEPDKPVNNARDSVFGFQPEYVVKSWKQLKDPDGYPGIKPPWGTMNAIDLNSGETLWSVPLGEYPELAARGIKATGTDNYGGPVVTAGGLVFIAATKDEKIRAFDKETGEVLWEHQLPAAGFATPVTYEVNGRQYLVIAAGGGRGLKTGGKYVAFGL